MRKRKKELLTGFSVSMPVEMDDELYRLAHEQDISKNKYIVGVLRNHLDNLESFQSTLKSDNNNK